MTLPRERQPDQVAKAVIVLDDQYVSCGIAHESPSRRPMVLDENCDG